MHKDVLWYGYDPCVAFEHNANLDKATDARCFTGHSNYQESGISLLV